MPSKGPIKVATAHQKQQTGIRKQSAQARKNYQKKHLKTTHSEDSHRMAAEWDEECAQAAVDARGARSRGGN